MNALIRKNSRITKFKYDYLDHQTFPKYRHYNTKNQIESSVQLQKHQQEYENENKENLFRIGNSSLKPQQITSVISLLSSNGYFNTLPIPPPSTFWCSANLDAAFPYQVRQFHLNSRLLEQVSSKVEATIQAIQEKQKEEQKKAVTPSTTSGTEDTSIPVPPVDIKKSVTAPTTKETVKQTVASATPATPVETKPVAVVKKSLKQRIWDEILHYYHGFRLLFVDINVCRKLLWRVLQGKTLTRRENRLLIRTTSDLFRLVPFSIFIIIPFMELLLPVFIKFFPGMLPSTFQTSKEREDKLKQSLTVKLEVAKFLQKTLDEMAVESKDSKSEEARQFAVFFQKIKDPNEFVSNEEIIKFSKRFEDEITLDALSREQLVALCRVLGVNTIATTNLLRFQLRMKMRSLAADDRIIAKEGVEALNLYELQLANKNRGMRAYGLSEQQLRDQLNEWIELSLNEKVPPSLLLLSRALMISEEVSTTDKLKDTIRSLPDTLATQAKGNIGELEGKIDNKTKIEIIKEEVRKIKEEREEARQDVKDKQKIEEQAKIEKAEILIDKAPVLTDKAPVLDEAAESVATRKSPKAQVPVVEATQKKSSISTEDVKLLDEALNIVAKDKNKLLKEKEVIKELKEEIEDYKEDIEELKKISEDAIDKKLVDVKESKAAKLLYKKVNNMIGRLDKVLNDLEVKEKEIKEAKEPEVEKPKEEQDLVKITELVEAIQGLQKVSDEGRLQTIENVLSKIDIDRDGHIKVNDVIRVIEAIGKENVHLNEKQLSELIELIEKEDDLEVQEKIEKALAKEKAAKELSNKLPDEELKDKAPVLTDKAENILDKTEKELTKSLEADVVLKAAENQKEKLLPKDVPDIPASAIPPPPTSKSSETSTNPSDKSL